MLFGFRTFTSSRRRSNIIIIAVASLFVTSLGWHWTRQPAPVLLGVYDDQQGWNMRTVRAMEAWQHKRHAVVTMFTNWCDEPHVIHDLFKQQLPNIWNNRNVPMITWEPFLCTRQATPPDIEVRIAKGDYDGYIHQWAAKLRMFLSGPDHLLGTADDRRVYLRLAHEMNIESYPWSTDDGNTHPQAYREMWQHVWQILRDYGLGEQTVQWVWCVNFVDGNGSPAEAFYPGNDYVDWMAVDGYNWGRSETWSTWQTPTEVFEPMLRRLQALSGKPIAITEVGTSAVADGGINADLKAAWIADFFRRVPRWNVKMVAWFNADKAHEWAVFNGQVGDSTFTHERRSYRAFASYRTALARDIFLPSDSTHPRLLTDLQFSGH